MPPTLISLGQPPLRSASAYADVHNPSTRMLKGIFFSLLTKQIHLCLAILGTPKRSVMHRVGVR